jgi:hypothetical protein
MSKILLLAVALSAGLAGAASAEIHGSWTAVLDSERPDRMYMNITRKMWQHNGNTMKLADFAGLTREQAESDTQVLVQFKIARDAGTIAFEGTFKRGDGAGQFSFQPNLGYPQALREMGIEFELKRRRPKSDEEVLFDLAMLDVSPAYVRAMQAAL